MVYVMFFMALTTYLKKKQLKKWRISVDLPLKGHRPTLAGGNAWLLESETLVALAAVWSVTLCSEHARCTCCPLVSHLEACTIAAPVFKQSFIHLIVTSGFERRNAGHRLHHRGELAASFKFHFKHHQRSKEKKKKQNKIFWETRVIALSTKC